jgi:hypothetical protein
MPMKSQKQNALMRAVAGGYSNAVPKSVAEKFVSESHGQKVSKLPKYAHKFHRLKSMMGKK